MAGNKVYGAATNVMGDNAADTIGFYGVTPVVQPSGATQGVTGVVSVASLSATVWGFSCSATYYATVQLLEAIRTALVSQGLIKGAA